MAAIDSTGDFFDSWARDEEPKEESRQSTAMKLGQVRGDVSLKVDMFCSRRKTHVWCTRAVALQ